MRGTVSHLSRFFTSPAVAMLVVYAGAALAETPHHPQSTAHAPSVPIELPDVAPVPDEVVGGLILEIMIALGIVFLIAAIVILSLELSHHHIFWECEECRHHDPEPPPRAQLPPPPAPGN